LTFSRVVSKLRTRNESRRRVVSGLTHQKPWSLSVPLYSPNSCSTRASFGFTTVRPKRPTVETTSAVTHDRTAQPLWLRTAEMKSGMQATITATSTNSISQPETPRMSFSRNIGLSRTITSS
jgi:hypothetical protein